MWDEETLRRRITSSDERTRFAGASPDDVEVAVYEESVADQPREGQALVLGMTPELRRMAGRRFSHLTSVDMSAAAIDLYRGWVAPEVDETVRCEGWFAFLMDHRRTFTAVFGDGIFGNVDGRDAALKLLELIGESLTTGGRFVTRMAMVPSDHRPEEWRFTDLLERYRNDEIDAAELGMSARLLSHLDRAYDTSSSLLDNAVVYAEIDRAAAASTVSDDELRVLRAFQFGGRNYLPEQRDWEAMLGDAGMRFRAHPLTDKLWRSYYQVYECWCSAPA